MFIYTVKRQIKFSAEIELTALCDHYNQCLLTAMYIQALDSARAKINLLRKKKGYDPSAKLIQSRMILPALVAHIGPLRTVDRFSAGSNSPKIVFTSLSWSIVFNYFLFLALTPHFKSMLSFGKLCRSAVSPSRVEEYQLDSNNDYAPPAPRRSMGGSKIAYKFYLFVPLPLHSHRDQYQNFRITLKPLKNRFFNEGKYNY